MNCQSLSHTQLFLGMSPQDIEEVLPCLGAHERSFAKGEAILRAGDVTREIGLVEKGSANVVVNLCWGETRIFGHIPRGDIFAQNYAALPDQQTTCDIVAVEPTRVLFVSLERLLTTCTRACGHHRQLIYNLVRISAEKSLGLSRRMMHIAPKTIRGRVLSYLSELAARQGGPRVRTPFSRQQLAEYLGVNRSALSKELGKMRQEGLLTYHLSEFVLSDDALRQA